MNIPKFSIIKLLLVKLQFNVFLPSSFFIGNNVLTILYTHKYSHQIHASGL